MKQFLKRMKHCMISKLHSHNQGLSLVELICAMAILGVVTASVGSIMVISAKHYERGVTEVGLQQEAQFAANQIADLVIDTTAEVTYTDAGTAKELSIQKEDRCYKVTYRSADCKIVLSEYQINADNTLTLIGEADQLMAENVADFEAIVPADFMESGSLQLCLKFEEGERNFESWYTITARNGVLEENIVEASATLITESEVTLEPNQTFLLEATVIGPANTNVVWGLENNNDTDTLVYQDGVTGLWYLKIGRDETSDTMQLQVKTVATGSDNITPLATRYIPVHVRRVNAMTISGAHTSGTEYASGSTYSVTATLDGTSLARVLSVNYDVDYVDPYQIEWNYTLTDEAGNEVSNVGDYIDYNESRTGTTPFTDITLKQDLGSMVLTVTATAMHPAGTNKSTQSYDSFVETWILDAPEVTIPVDGKSLLGVEIIPTSLEAFHPKYASAVTVSGYTAEEKEADLVYTWSVDRTDCVEAYNNGTGGKTFDVQFLESSSNQIITITLRVKSIALSAAAGHEVYKEDSVTYVVPKSGDSGDSYLERGKDGNNNIQCDFAVGGYDWMVGGEDSLDSWDIYVCDEDGNIIADPGINIEEYVEIYARQSMFIANIKKELPLDRDFYILVQIHKTNWSGALDTYERIIYIPKTSLVGKDATLEWSNPYYNGFDIDYYLYGFDVNDWKKDVDTYCGIELVDCQISQPEGANVTATVYFDRMFEYDQTVNNLRWQGHIVLSGDGFQNASVTSMTVKIYSKLYPSIYCYSTITFTDNE